MSSHFLPYQNHRIHFHKFGHGDRLLIALHGFGDQSSIFHKLEPALASHFTTYALDLPFHGQTRWTATSYTAQDILQLLQLIAKQEQQNTFSLMGYSLGGRIVLRLLPELLPQLERIFLLAPDGLRTQWMTSVTRTPVWLRLAAKRALQNPKWLLKLSGVLHRQRWLGAFPYRFVQTHLANPQRQARLFGTWLSLDGFRVHPGQIHQLLDENQLPTDFYFGQHDPIIRPVSAATLADLPNVNIHIVETGHQLVGTQVRDLLWQQLSENGA